MIFDTQIHFMTHHLKLTYLLLFFLFYHYSLTAQKYFFNQIKDFPSTHINCMAVDSQNIKWIGTENGLIRLKDEETFHHYTEANSRLRDNQINCLNIDQAQNKWLGSYSKGLMCLTSSGQFAYYPFANAKILLITAIAITPIQEVLVATSTDGVYYLKGEKLYPKWRINNSRLPSNRVDMIKTTASGSILIGTDHGLCEVINHKWKIFSKIENVKDVQQMRGIWFASSLTKEGPKLWVKSDRKWEVMDRGMFTYDIQLKEIVLGNQYLWLLSDKGLIRFDGKQDVLFDERYGLSQAVSAVTVDQKDVIWVGTVNKGLFKQGERPKKPKLTFPSVHQQGIQPNKLLRMEYAKFQQSTANLLDSNIWKELNVIIEFLYEHPDTKIEIHGHTDDTGSQLKNWELSKKRTLVILKYLAAAGIEKNRLMGLWYGENEPLVPNTSEKNKQLNRRVEIRIVTKR